MKPLMAYTFVGGEIEFLVRVDSPISQRWTPLYAKSAVEAAYREGFRNGFDECAREDRGIEGDGEDAAWNTYVEMSAINASVKQTTAKGERDGCE